jgi:Cu/Ag efflux pump CusA
VLGKAGRAETATDPAPLSMLETVITLKPKSEWRRTDTWYSAWAPERARAVLRHITPDHISQQEPIGQMNDALTLPGLANGWTMPMKGRIDMLGCNMSIGVWVGLIALLGVDAETGVFMLLYLGLAYEEARREGRLRSLGDLREAIMQGAVKRLRPKFMTVVTTFFGLIPIMWSMGTGADVMKRIAAPMIGGTFTSFLLELLVYPVIYEIWKWNSEVKRRIAAPEAGDAVSRPGWVEQPYSTPNQ